MIVNNYCVADVDYGSVFRGWCCVIVFFFFKQKTAYEMRISDWSSDVCSSDLFGAQLERRNVALKFGIGGFAEDDDRRIGALLIGAVGGQFGAAPRRGDILLDAAP